MRLLIVCACTLVALANGQGLLSKVDSLIAQTALEFGSEVQELVSKIGLHTDYPSHYSPKTGEEYDFIIIGAGMMGCVLANRLTEITGWKVLLIEAGDDPPFAVEVPALATTLFNTEVDWQYKTEPDGVNCLGYKNKRCSYIRGKMLGGTYNLGFNIYIAAKEKDYEQWAAQGITGWSYKEVLPYVRKSESMRIKSVLESSPGQHGTEGPVKIDSWVDFGTFNKYYSSAMEELGYPQNPDITGSYPSGYSQLQGSLEDGRRFHPAKAYLTPIKDRSNLKVSKNSLVSKILIDEDTKTAKGVEFINKEGKTIQVFAKKEAILSAGAIGSPQILMLSGVGPKKHLEELSIKVLSDLPVGHNVQDFHAFTSALLTTNYSDPSVSQTKSLLDFLLKKPTILNNGLPFSHGVAFSTENDKSYPNGFIFMPRIPQNNSANVNSIVTDTFGFDDWVKQQYFQINSEATLLVPLTADIKSRSQGKVELRSTDPKEHPKIYAGFFTDERDVEDFLAFYDFLEEMVNTEGFKAINVKIHELRAPECERFQYGTKDYRRCALPYFSTQYTHLTGSCKMGAVNSPDSVVDPELRVKGIKNLRVVDYSIVPDVNRITGYGIGEKAADLIKEAWKTEMGSDVEDKNDDDKCKLGITSLVSCLKNVIKN